MLISGFHIHDTSAHVPACMHTHTEPHSLTGNILFSKEWFYFGQHERT